LKDDGANELSVPEPGQRGLTGEKKYAGSAVRRPESGGEKTRKNGI